MLASTAYLTHAPSDYVDGVFRSLRGDAITTRDPANPDAIVWQGTPVGAHAEDAVAAARRAFPAWSALSFDERRVFLERWRDTCVKHAARLAAAISREIGKVKWEAELEAKIVAEKVTITLEDRVVARVTGFEVAAGAGKTGICSFKPHGVMAVLGPYNFPAHLPNGHIVPALLLGNTIVFKPSEKGASVGQLMAELAHEVGFPAGVFNVVQGSGVIASRLATHPEVDGVLFTGSFPVGRRILEANLDIGRGPVATVLVDKGTLKVGDPIVAGAAWGKVRALINERGEQIKEAGPSTPVQVLGLSSVPQAGDEFRSAPDEKTARVVGDARGHSRRILSQRGDSRVQGGVKLEDIFSQIQAGEVATLNLVIKADVQGSLEAVSESLRKLERPEVKVAFVHRGVGGITENDITLAATTNATLIGFNVRPDRKSRDLAETEKVEIRTYEIIYKLLEDMERAMLGLLAPEFEEVVTGEAEVREIFRVPKLGAIAGCVIRTGVITRGTKVRFLRDGTIIWKGSIQSLRRFKDDVREVREGFECGIGLSDFQDLKPGDLIETFEEREIARV